MTRIPIRQVMAVGLSLAETYEMCWKFIRNAGLDMQCEAIHFDPGLPWLLFVCAHTCRVNCCGSQY
jgi:hypothetical protein